MQHSRQRRRPVTAVSSSGVEPQGSVLGRFVPPSDAGPGSDQVTRAAAVGELATMLGIPSSALESISAADAAAALRRFRALRSRAAELESRATFDDLTGVLRRGAGIVALHDELARAKRLGVPLAVAFVDVDGLKRVNDIAGHHAGDEVLRTVGTTLRRGLRTYDVVLRYGGDEFVCGLLGCERLGAERLASDLGDRIAAATSGVTVSVGIAVLAPDDDLDTLLGRADAALLEQRRAIRADIADPLGAGA